MTDQLKRNPAIRLLDTKRKPEIATRICLPEHPDAKSKPGKPAGMAGYALAVLCMSALAACGGGSTDSAPPAATSSSVSAATTPTATPSTPAQSTPATSTDTSTPPASVEPSTSIPTPAGTNSEQWVPNVSDTWQWQLRGTVNTSYAVKVYDIDLFDTPQTTIDSLKAQGRRVVCYFSAGSSEDWRPDFSQFAANDMGNGLDGWPGERWLDTRSANVRAIMKKRLDLAKSKGCDGVEPDNVDGYTNHPGFPLNAATQLDYNKFLAAEAHARGLAVALKNDVDQVTDLISHFDFAVNEQCFEYDECGAYTAFTSQGKPVFNAEYASVYRTPGGQASLCKTAKSANVRTLVLPLKLDDTYRFACDS